ncbi:MAG: serine hydrolase domain-containing protein [Steroidobacteraceae bacterium]
MTDTVKAIAFGTLWGAAITMTTMIIGPAVCRAGPAAQALPASMLLAGRPGSSPVTNAAFYPGPDALTAPAFAGVLKLSQCRLQTEPSIERPAQHGRDARLLPGVDIEFFNLGDLLVPVRRGEMLREIRAGKTPSYWRVIAQIGRVWREQADGGWSRAAFPLMLVNDTENHAHQGLATFLYREGKVSNLAVQFIQQSAPYLLGRHFVAWGSVQVESTPANSAQLNMLRLEARSELAGRLPAKPWTDLVKSVPAGTLDGFGGPLDPKWLVAAALVRDGTLYYQDSRTAYGPYPYPLEMRFGVRSVMKSVGVPLSLLRLAEVYGPWVLDLKVGDYVAGLDAKWRRIRFLDAANMASGFGGTGSLRTEPNDIYDGYLEGGYDAWYTAPTHAQKIAQIHAHLRPYPWEPGSVVRYRDQDFYLLGAAIDGFLKSKRGPAADLWDMLKAEVFAPIGILHAPAVRTREAGGREGLVWLNAGYYPTLDDLAKIALLYQGGGAHDRVQILNRQLTMDLLAARDALREDGDQSAARATPEGSHSYPELYKMGFHFIPFTGAAGRLVYLPTMSGSGENEVTLYPNHVVSIVMAKAAELPAGERAFTDKGPETLRAVERLAPF